MLLFYVLNVGTGIASLFSRRYLLTKVKNRYNIKERSVAFLSMKINETLSGASKVLKNQVLPTPGFFIF